MTRMHPQRGATLLLGLLLLSLLSLLVTGAWSDSRWELRMASRDLSEDRALQAAESALHWAESWLMRQTGAARPLACAAACPIRTPRGSQVLAAQGERWWLGHGWIDGWDPAQDALSEPRGVENTPAGRWWIEEAFFEPGSDTSPATGFYRIIARAARAPYGEPVVLEALVARPWGQAEWQDGTDPARRSFCHALPAPVRCGRMAWQRLR